MISLAIDLDEGVWNDPVAIARQSLEAAFGPVTIMRLPVRVTRRPMPTAAEVVDIVAFNTGVTVQELIGESRYRRVARVRFAVYWLAHSVCGRNLASIGRALGGRNGKTITSGLGRAAELRDSDPAFRMLTDRLAAEIRGGRA